MRLFSSQRIRIYYSAHRYILSDWREMFIKGRYVMKASYRGIDLINRARSFWNFCIL